jgi:hypothetical protein
MSYLLLNSAGEIVVYPYSLSQLQIDNPNTSFPETMTEDALASWSVYRVVPNSSQTVDHTQNLEEVTPTIVDGIWTQTWAVKDASADEIAERTAVQADNVRQERNLRLSTSDWTQLADTPVDRLAWSVYRQALRDAPGQPGFPWDIQWPPQPE